MGSQGFNLDSLWIIGYGNPQRRDDGIGPYVAIGLRALLADMPSIHVVLDHQLDPAMVEDLKEAESVWFIDATVEPLAGGWQRSLLHPRIDEWPYLVHDIEPPLLLGLIKAFYGRCPEAWMVSVQGEDFGLGEGLSGAARQRADEAVNAIAEFVHSHTLSASPDLKSVEGDKNRPIRESLNRH